MTAKLDLTGQRFGRLVAVSCLGRVKKQTLWLCRCDCGNATQVRLGALRGGKQVSCGCKKKEGPPRLDLTGNRFGRLVATKYIGKRKNETMWELLCDCGNTTKASVSNLRSGQVKSCGCTKGQRRAQQLLRHGETGTRLYRIWSGMKRRCDLPTVKCYDDYGGRGIRVCEEWADSYEAFRDWSLANGYRDDLTIDRWPDTNGNYEPDNCRWGTAKEQARNRRTSRLLTVNGFTKTLAEWSELSGIPYRTIWDKLERGIAPEVILGA